MKRVRAATAIADERTASQSDRARPWRCSAITAYYCPIHHDCTCPSPLGAHGRRTRSVDCALHGEATTHPFAVETIL